MSAFRKEPHGIATPRGKAWWENIPEKWWEIYSAVLEDFLHREGATKFTHSAAKAFANLAWRDLHDQWADKTKEC